MDMLINAVSTISLINVMFMTCTLVITLVGVVLINWVPNSIINLYYFGKLTKLRKNLAHDSDPRFLRFINALRVPKRYFSHFYVFAIIYHVLVCGAVFWTYSGRDRTLPYIVTALDLVDGRDRQADNVEPVAIIIMCILHLLHIIQRCYECYYVSIFSDGTMHLMHYVLGYLFYWGLSTSLIVRAPGFNDKDFDPEKYGYFNWQWHELLGTALYFWAMWHQHKSMIILANLRRNRAGMVVTKAHKVPSGGWFNFVACPHFLAEILLYTALNLILSFRNGLLINILAFVTANQISAALLTHKFYIENFREYPKNRKAIIPFLL